MVCAFQDIKVKYGNDELLENIISEMDTKYVLYSWATIKENDRKGADILVADHAASTSEVELISKSDDEKEEERLTLYAVPKSTEIQVIDGCQRIDDILHLKQEEEYPRVLPYEDFGDKIGDILDWTLNTLNNSKDDVLTPLITENRITAVLFEGDANIALNGWHCITHLPIKYITPRSVNHIQDPSDVDFSDTDLYLHKMKNETVGFLFSFKDTTDFKCVAGQGIVYYTSFDNTLPYCLCEFGYGGDACDIPLRKSGSESGAVLKIVEKYKVPGMFDIQDEIRQNTNQIMDQMEENKMEIFRVARDTQREITNSKNSILSAQSMMLNKLKADNDKMLRGLTGFKDAIDTAFQRERDERIYMTEKGQSLVVRTINAASERVYNRLASLTGKVIENRYYETLTFTIPAFEKKFSAINKFGEYATKDFAEYLRLHELEFNAAKQAVENAILAETDSFIAAKMQTSMVSGCTAEYTEQIMEIWEEMFQTHLSLTSMEATILAHQIRVSNDPEEKAFLEYEEHQLNIETTATTEKFKKTFSERSCPGFSMPNIDGGGCRASITFPGQVVPMNCLDSSKVLVIMSTGTPITEITCNRDSTWAIDLADLKCMPKCVHDGKTYNIGETRLLPPPPKGLEWSGDHKGESICSVLPTELDAQNPIRGLLRCKYFLIFL